MHRSATKLVALVLGLILMTASAFWPVRHFAFLNYDDPDYVFQNSRVATGLSFENIRWAFTTTHFSYWHPLTWMSHMLDAELFGLHPGNHHTMNLVLHTLNAVLLFCALRLLTGALWKSLAVAAFFAVHPVNVESVAWISERKNMLVALFWFLTMSAYARYARRPGLGRYLVVAGCFSASIMSKPIAVTLPFVLLLLDFWPLGRLGGSNRDGVAVSAPAAAGRLVLEKVPLLMLSVAASVTTFLSQQSIGSVKSLTLYPLPARLGNSLIAYVRYLGKMLWPQDLAVIYPHPGTSLPVWKPVAAGMVVLGVTVGALALARRRGYLPVGWFWFLGTLVPVIGLVQSGGQSMADRYAYLPMIGIATIAAWGLSDLTAGWRPRAALLVPLAAGALVMNLAVTSRQVGYWMDSETLFRRALAVTEDNFVAHSNLGDALLRKGAYKEAEFHFREAVRIRPSFAVAHMNLSRALEWTGKREEAFFHFNEAVRISKAKKK